MNSIDVEYDFTSDTKGYWENYWIKDHLLGSVNKDPDSSSKTLRLYHKMLYSRPLPNGEQMKLEIGSGANYLTWNGYRFGSDSIIVSFRYKRYRNMIEQVANTVPNYHGYIEDYIHRSYTIGGEIIFPKRKWGIN